MATKVTAEFVPVPRNLSPRERDDVQKGFDVDILETLESEKRVVAYAINDNEEARKQLLAHLRSAVRWVNRLEDDDTKHVALRQGQDGKSKKAGEVVIVYALVKATKRPRESKKDAE